MLKKLIGFAAVGLLVMGVWGCGGGDEAKPVADVSGSPDVPDVSGSEHGMADVAYCGTCGNEAGAEQCCVDGAEKCEACGLTKGSTLCCKLENAKDYKDQTLCGKCGHVEGDDKCCMDGAAVCDQCGLHAGSPLCCKLPQQ